LRIGITAPWVSRWFFTKAQKFFVEEDVVIREIINERIMHAGIANIEIERTAEKVRVNIKASRPGLIIGRGGKGIEELKNIVQKKMEKARRKREISGAFSLNLNVEELKRLEVSAAVVGQQIASDLERRMPFRLIMRRQLETLEQKREVKGVKVQLAGRLNGAEIARTEKLGFGRMPAQTIRADIDYGEATARTTYGAIGIKVWIYKGDIFEEK